MNRLIFHIDVNSAFLSWEAARRVAAGQEDLRLIPSAIGGDPEKRTGVILAKSIPAKQYGIQTGEPVGMALRKCPQLILAKPDFRLYEENSKAFMDICRKYAPVVEKYSIDECFLDMTGTSWIYPDYMAIAHEIKDTIRDTLGFTVNVGIGSNKMLAKMASDFEKPDKVHTLFQDEIQKKMWPLPVRELFSIGGSTAEKLEKSYIRTIGQIAQNDLRSIQAIVGKKMGQQIHEFANGIDYSPVLDKPEEAKGYSNSTTLPQDIRNASAAHQVLLALSDSVSSRIRTDGVKAYCVSVTIRGNDFKTKSHQRKLDEATDITQEIYEVSRQLFDDLWDKRTPIRLLGISLTQITHEVATQLSLFSNEKKEKKRKVDQAMDAIRSKFGADTIKRASFVQSTLEVERKHQVLLPDTSQIPKG